MKNAAPRSLISIHQKTLSVLAALGYSDLLAHLEKAWQPMIDTLFGIVVLGEFKTGKSTLINRVFLDGPVLFTDLMEATAVPTQIRFGETKQLTIIPRDAANQTPYAPEPVSGSGTQVRATTLIDPSPQDIQSRTAADTPEHRMRLAMETAEVRLAWPAANLKGLIVYDTPGINTLNTAVVTTTYGIVPRADLAVFLTRARQLNTTEMDFLASRVFALGISRCMVVMGLHPDDPVPTSDQRRQLMESVRHQLAHIGRSHVMVDLVRFADETAAERKAMPHGGAPRSGASGRESINAVIQALMGPADTPDRALECSPSAPEADISLSSFAERLLRFIREHAPVSRQDKARHILREILQKALGRCVAALTALSQDQASRKEMLNGFRQREARLLSEHAQMRDRLKTDLSRTRQALMTRLNDRLDRLADGCLADVDACTDLGSLQDRLKHMQETLSGRVEAVFGEAFDASGQELATLFERYGVQNRDLMLGWERALPETIRPEGGFLAKVPPFALLAADLMLFIRFGPFGPVADLLIRMLIHFVPYINRILLPSLAMGILKQRIRASLTEQVQAIKAVLPQRIGARFDTAADAMIHAWSDHIHDQLATLRKGLEDILDPRSGPGNPADVMPHRLELENLMGALDDLEFSEKHLFP